MLASSPGNHKCILHLTTGKNAGQAGSRIPGVWLLNQDFYISFNTDQAEQWFTYPNIPLNQKMSFKMERVLIAGQSIVRTFIDQHLVSNQPHGFNEPFKNVKFYLGDPWYDPAPVKIFGLKYRSTTTKDKANP